MSTPLRLTIATPCHEDWGKMQPSEKGRYCLSCQKNVVDFTEMSDVEIFAYMKYAGTNVCGRMKKAQMGRELRPMQIQRNGGKGWPWLLAGAMLTADGAPPSMNQIVLGEMMVLPKETAMDRFRALPHENEREETIVKGTVQELISDTAITGAIVAGPTEIQRPRVNEEERDVDSLPALAPLDSVVKVECARNDNEEIVAGKITVEREGAASIGSTALDTVQKFVKDTLTALRILPKQTFSVFPNPAVRGEVIHLAWKGDAGTYRVSIYTMGGALVQSRVIVVGSASQIDGLELPAGIGAGVYVVRAIRAGAASGSSQRVVVQ